MSELVIAGPIMARRAAYQFGLRLEPGPLGHVDCGLGSPQLRHAPIHRMAQSMTVEHLIDIIGVRFDPAAFDAEPFTVNLHFTDLGEDHVLGVGRSAVHHRPGTVDPDAAASVRIDRHTLLGAIQDAEALDGADIAGDRRLVHAFLSSLTVFTPSAIIEPSPPTP